MVPLTPQVAMTFFQYLHAPADLASVYGLTAAYAAASMIPSNGVLREITQNTQTSVLPTLMKLEPKGQETRCLSPSLKRPGACLTALFEGAILVFFFRSVSVNKLVSAF